uniref:7TM GPCR serpentine receptor class x (Srx) domain-containing protein n=1 Tax=Ascaris lumbricoides TaxID=6252 RepID=A0A0M3HXG1_ASCLU
MQIKQLNPIPIKPVDNCKIGRDMRLSFSIISTVFQLIFCEIYLTIAAVAVNNTAVAVYST